MDISGAIGNLLKQYTGASATNPSPTAEQDFEQYAQTAPQDSVAHGLSEAFRSDQTPDFGSMLGGLFGNSDGHQRAGVLNTLLSAAGPGLLGGVLGKYLGGSQQNTQITPEQAQQIPPEEVKQLGQQAMQQDPSIIDRVSQYYAAHPQLIKTLGGAALTLALAKAAEKRGLGF